MPYVKVLNRARIDRITARIVHCAYPTCRHYDAKRIYGTTKLANLLMARELSKRLKPHNVVSNAVHPGTVQTDLMRNIPFLGPLIYQIMGMLFKTAKVGIS